jgi:hypothetical protein
MVEVAFRLPFRVDFETLSVAWVLADELNQVLVGIVLLLGHLLHSELSDCLLIEKSLCFFHCSSNELMIINLLYTN